MIRNADHYKTRAEFDLQSEALNPVSMNLQVVFWGIVSLLETT